MSATKPTILVTGISGNLGQRLLLQLGGFEVVGVDKAPPAGPAPAHFYPLDLGHEPSCRELVALLRKHHVSAVIHLAFVIDPLMTGVLDSVKMWQINVAGTARVMEAIAEVNRHENTIRKFVFLSSVSAYGPETPGAVAEEHPLAAHTLPYAIHKMEADRVVQERAEALGDCSTYMFRPHIFTGATMQNYLVGALRGTPTGKGWLGRWLRKRGTRLPIVLPMGRNYLENAFQFVHVDDVARLIAYTLRRSARDPQLTILNVAGRGDSLSFAECARLANGKVLKLPGRWLCGLVLRIFWALGISGVPPAALPYITGSYTMDTSRLRIFLGDNYKSVVQHTVKDALADSFNTPREPQVEELAATRSSSL